MGGEEIVNGDFGGEFSAPESKGEVAGFCERNGADLAILGEQYLVAN